MGIYVIAAWKQLLEMAFSSGVFGSNYIQGESDWSQEIMATIISRMKSGKVAEGIWWVVIDQQNYKALHRNLSTPPPSHLTRETESFPK